jgi:hypothetical protein
MPAAPPRLASAATVRAVSRRPVTTFGVIFKKCSRSPGAHGVKTASSRSISNGSVISWMRPTTVTLHPVDLAESISSVSNATTPFRKVAESFVPGPVRITISPLSTTKFIG